MISALLLDLGDTLESHDKPYPGALEALEILAKGAACGSSPQARARLRLYGGRPADAGER